MNMNSFWILLVAPLVITTRVTATNNYPTGRQILDFDGKGEERGMYLTNIFYQNMGINFIGCENNHGKRKCRIFDTRVPVGQWEPHGRGVCNCGPISEGWPKTCDNIWPDRCGDPDLSPPFRNLDNVLITDECADYSEPPDDDDQGGIFTFRFHCDATIHLIGFLDVEEKSRPDIKFIRSDGTTVEKGPYTLNNRYKNKTFEQPNVRELQIKLYGSGAIGLIEFTLFCPTEQPPTEAPTEQIITRATTTRATTTTTTTTKPTTTTTTTKPTTTTTTTKPTTTTTAIPTTTITTTEPTTTITAATTTSRATTSTTNTRPTTTTTTTSTSTEASTENTVTRATTTTEATSTTTTSSTTTSEPNLPRVNPCGTHTLEFEDYGESRGQFLEKLHYWGKGIPKLACKSQRAEEGLCRIFNTDVPIGRWPTSRACNCGPASKGFPRHCDQSDAAICGNENLVSPPGHDLGNVLIVDDSDETTPPNDNADGGSIIIQFESPVTVDSITFLGAQGSSPIVKLKLTSQVIQEIEPNTVESIYQEIAFHMEDVIEMEITLRGPGAIPSITYTWPNACSTGNGDPHIQRWNQGRSSFHGECDLVMVHSDQFHDSAGLDLHLRTTIRNDLYSYIEAAALRLGEHVIELQKDGINVDGQDHEDSDLPVVFGEKYLYRISTRKEVNRHHEREKKFYMVQLGDDSSIEFKFWRHYTSVKISGNPRDFGDAIGLSGAFPSGDMFARSGKHVDNFVQYGFEWQVDPAYDPILFRSMREPQLPHERCRMPTGKTQSRRKLRGANRALLSRAKEACRVQRGSDFDLCVDDVMITGEVGLGDAW